MLFADLFLHTGEKALEILRACALTLVFFLVVVPYGFAYRLFAGTLMRHFFRPSRSSFYTSPKVPPHPLDFTKPW